MEHITDPKKRTSSAKSAHPGKAFRDLTKGRICNECHIYKDRDHFYEHPHGFNGLSSRCRECASVLSKTEHTSEVKKALYDKRRANNECVRCESKDLVTNIHCKECWFLDKGSVRAGGILGEEIIKRLWDEQEGRCFYSGEVLVPGKNASIDHQIPRSKGGSNEISNLKWVSRTINMMKNDMDHDEFLLMCKKIVDRFSAYISELENEDCDE